jgi:hypothetical protein
LTFQVPLEITLKNQDLAPNDAKTIWSNPLILFIHQPIASPEGEQTVKTLL